MICGVCGAPLEVGARFCSQCGTAVGADDTEATGQLTAVEAEEAAGPELPGLVQNAVLVVYRGPSQGTAFPLTPPVVRVGRGPEQEVFLDDITVSRQHAELRATGAGWQIVDLGSLNGTYVNSVSTTEAVLANGDEIQIGKYRFRFMSWGGGQE